MNTRVLELIKNPKIITESDLEILESESVKMPYAQSIRAIYLYGINLYQPENYKEHLSKTAAYTTDKKILYQFINSEKIARKETINETARETQYTEAKDIKNENPELTPARPELVEAIESTDTHSVINNFDVEKIIEAEAIKTEEFIVVNGEKNRLLYEGEENFLEEKTPEVDLEASKESGQLTLKEEAETVEKLISIDENPSEETIASPEISQVSSDEDWAAYSEMAEPEPEIESKDISFSGSQDFLPEVKFFVPKNHLDYLNPPKKEKKENTTVENPAASAPKFVDHLPENELQIEDSNAISFENTQSFEVKTTDEFHKDADVRPEEKTENLSFETPQEFELIPEVDKNQREEPADEKFNTVAEETVPEPESEWKPMQLDAHIPDALIGKKPEIVIETEKVSEMPVVQEIKPEIPGADPIGKTEIAEIIDEENTEEEPLQEPERPVFNVSFFGQEVSKIEEKQESHEEKSKEHVEEDKASNVGTFINTWQSWLKIDRPKVEENPVKAKEKIIDNFIENNPKISQLKEESNFVIKEKKDDISHLMTETLARLYTDQKLYSKAIKAYEILSEKHPQKKDYFREKIEEIKEMRKP